ncbi:MAG: M28 family peptidase [Chloroflexi bacterium]|nr:M28 family peptidase [Chloroflexota bacterium]
MTSAYDGRHLTTMTTHTSSSNLTGFTPSNAKRQLALEERLQALITSEAFKHHLEAITQEPHIAGTEANVRVGQRIAEAMQAAGLRVEEAAYDVYLPRLDDTDIDVALVTPIRLPLNNQEYILDEDAFSSHPDLKPGWNAYCGNGDVTAEVVYANYGTKEDFEQLHELGVSIEGKIVVARFGGNFRGYKAQYAQEYGAVGLIIYSDPADGGYTAGAEYPEGRFINASTVQRGSLLTLDYPGDPLTPFEPALPLDSGIDVHRLDPSEVAFHTIPVAPLPHGSAREILERMEGPVVPSGWQGSLPFTYRVSGGPGLTVRLRVNQPCGLTRATNIIGILEGSEYPDEWVILGCHYDAWNFGTADPNSGTAMLLTLVDALGQLTADGWRPRRTILIGHWDAEEHGIIGSTEWVEQYRDELTEKAVAYINADMAVTGPNVSASASPSLKRPIIEATGAVQYPGTDETVHSHWTKNTPGEEPAMENLGGGSDHMGFYMHIGVPAGDVSLASPVPIYHSSYDNMAWYERFGDTEFLFGPTVARVDGVLATRIANADLLPYDVARYTLDLRHHIQELEKRAQTLNVTIDAAALRAVVDDLAEAAARLEAGRDALLSCDVVSEGTLQWINRGLLALERTFIRQDGLQGRPWHRSLYASQDPFSGYAAWVLPGLRYEIERRSEDGFTEWQAIYVQALRALTQRVEQIADLISRTLRETERR